MSGTSATHSRLASLTRRQLGLVTKDQALAAGFTYDQVRHRLHTGELVAAGRGVYRLGGAPATWEQRALAAVLSVGHDAVLSDRSAATVWKLDLPCVDRVEVLTADGRGWRGADGPVTVRRVRSLRRQDHTRLGVFPVTTLPRTLVDLAGALDAVVLRRVVDDALSRRLTTPARVGSTIEGAGRRGRRGIGLLELAVEPWLGNESMDSVAEAAWLRRIVRAGLPAPVCQYVILRPDGVPATVDFAWPEVRLVLEVDSFRWHADARSHSRDIERANAIAAAGWVVLRTTLTELEERPAGIIATLGRHLATVIPAPCSTLETAGFPAAGR